MTADLRSIGQQHALDELRLIASAGASLQIVEEEQRGGYLCVDVSVDCANLTSVKGGIVVRARERLTILIPPAFPFSIPIAKTRHTRWAGTPHVQWGRQLCLYVSPAMEWDPADGMAGFVNRLVLFLERAAAGELDAPGAALHPPVAYAAGEAGLMVVRANAPRIDDDGPWLGVALLRRVSEKRVDLVRWRRLGEPWPKTFDEAMALAGVDGPEQTFAMAPAIVLPRPISFEYPANGQEMVEAFQASGVDAELVVGMLGIVSRGNRRLVGASDFGREDEKVPPLYVVVGTPSRGIAGTTSRVTHLVAWKLPVLAEQIASLAPEAYSDVPELAKIGREALRLGEDWLRSAETNWLQVQEMRDEVVIARDATTAAEWLRGKRVLILGAGALGGQVAEACVRGRAARVVIVDRAVVNAGILVRQPYEDRDIGLQKASALAARLRRIYPSEVEVEPRSGDIVKMVLDDGFTHDEEFDLVIDATADRTVRAAIESRWSKHRTSWPHLITMLIGHDAKRGVAALSRSGTSGAGVDVLRRLSLAARAEERPELADIVEDFFPDPPRDTQFQPEPGCSDVTFIGSSADVTGLAGELFAGVLQALDDPRGGMFALIIRAPARPQDPPVAPTNWFHWGDDVVVRDPGGDWEIRVAATAVTEIRAEARRGARVRGARVETGGSLLGGFDSAAGVVWVDEATGPPPDSMLSSVHFEHGLEGVEERIGARRNATARVTTFIGMWHSHPFGCASPSPTDEVGMRNLVLPVASAPPRALLLIAGGQARRWESFLSEGAEPDMYAAVVARRDTPAGEPRRTTRPQGNVTWFRGGSGARARQANASEPTRMKVRAWLRGLFKGRQA